MREYVSILSKNILGYLSMGITCSEKRTVSFDEQIISRDNYLSISLCKLEAVVFLILQIFFQNTCSSENWGISRRCSPVLAMVYPVMCLTNHAPAKISD